MPTFRQRPLTWLFVIATVCLDVVLVSTSFTPDDSLLAQAGLGFIIGQMFILGGWLALGEPHRLLRAGVYVAAVLALTTLICVWVIEGGNVLIEEWGLVLASVVPFSAIAALAAGVTSFLGGAIRGRRTLQTPVRFPVVELLGWMVVVAVASAALRFTDFTDLAAPGAEWMVSGGSAALAGLICALLDRRDATTLLANLAISVVLVIAFVVGANALSPDDIRVALTVAYVSLAAWIGAGWLDKHAVGIPLQRGNGPSACGDGPDAANAADLRVVSLANENAVG